MAHRHRIYGMLVIAAVAVVVTGLLRPDDADGPGRRPATDIEVVPIPRPEGRTPATPAPGAQPGPGSRASLGEREDPERVRTLLGRVSRHPALASWLAVGDLVERAASAVESVASGYSPRDELGFLAPRAAFVVERRGDSLVISDWSHRRFDHVVEVVSAVNLDAAYAAYLQLEPALSAAHRRIAFGDASFRERFVDAIDHLLEVDVPSVPLEVERGSLTYAFADPALEGLTDAQRQLLRLGPRNARRIQAVLLVFRDRLTGEPESFPEHASSRGSGREAVGVASERGPSTRNREPADVASSE